MHRLPIRSVRYDEQKKQLHSLKKLIRMKSPEANIKPFSLIQGNKRIKKNICKNRIPIRV